MSGNFSLPPSLPFLLPLQILFNDQEKVYSKIWLLVDHQINNKEEMMALQKEKRIRWRRSFMRMLFGNGFRRTLSPGKVSILLFVKT